MGVGWEMLPVYYKAVCYAHVNQILLRAVWYNHFMQAEGQRTGKTLQPEKVVLAHRGCFNAECEKLYRENSIEACKVSAQKDYIQIIELDVRKSADGILYCYHGTLFQHIWTLRFRRSFQSLKKKYGVDTLENILAVVPQDKIVFLDIKDRGITRDDVLKVFSGKQFKQIILGNKSVRFLRQFSNMRREFVKMLNGNVVAPFYDLEKLADDNFKYFEVVFPFQVKRRLMERARMANLEFRCSGLFFTSNESYWQTIRRFGIKHITSTFL